MTVSITWRPTMEGTCLTAYSGSLSIGFVIQRIDGSHAWQIDRVHTKYIVKGFGECRSLEAGCRALTRAWRIWCERAGLVSA